MDSQLTASSLRPEDIRIGRLAAVRARQWPLTVLLLLSGLTYFWDLTINGWGNPYYAAAAQAASADWTSLLYGAADAGNGLTVDKPPLHIWVLALSVKVFGLSPLSVLAPQAVMGMLSTVLVHQTIMFLKSPRLAFMAALGFILTPVSAMIFRFNNPDSLMILLWIASVYLTAKSIHTQRPGLLYAAAFLLGAAFLCKQFQGWIILPAVVASYLLIRPGGFWISLRRLLLAAAALIAPAFSWVALVELTPPAGRPWVGGSPNNSILELTFGYNGLGRLTGQTALGASNPKDFSGVVGYDAGILRLISVNYAPETAWLLPVALVGAVLTAARLRKAATEPIRRFLLVLMLVWFVTVFSLLSFMTGDIHPYYTSMLTVPLAFLAAYAAEEFWQHRSELVARRFAAVTVLVSVFMASGYLTWFQDWQPWIGATIKTSSLAAAGLLAIPRMSSMLTMVATALSAVALLLVPSSFIISSNSTSQQGSFPISGPVPTIESWHRRDAEQLLLGEQEKYSQARGEPVVHAIAELVAATPDESTWAAATTGAQNAALYQLTTGRPVMAIGGFSAGDAYPSLQKFRQLVSEGRITYYVHQPGILSWTAVSPETTAVVEWIMANYEYREIEGVRLYELRRQ